jgi:DNA phosphorothioation-dependent restriction protein DptG
MDFKLNTQLPAANSKNVLNTYFPVRTKDRKKAFDWDVVLGHFVKYSYCKELKESSLEKFMEFCRDNLCKKLDDPKLWDIIETMYFKNNGLFSISPELLLFKAQKSKGSAPDSRLGEFFNSMLNGFYFKEKPKSRLNFLEQEILESFESIVHEGVGQGGVVKLSDEQPYLPFLSKYFVEDLEFLGSKPKYLLSVFKDFLKLYGFLYTAQLALNIKEWRSGLPVSKPCYFIVDNEKASEERSHVYSNGFKQLNKSLLNIFPYLSMNEALQNTNGEKIPIWRLAELVDENDDLEVLNQFKTNFALERGIASGPDAETCHLALEEIFNLAVAQFKRGESRHEINVTYARTIEIELCGPFIQSRGRVGRVLVFNQDLLILLTNLAIGTKERLRFHELITSFQSRGVYFDKQSQQVLVDLFERIGNVERMSDSGDAVYVRKTI